MKWLRVWMAMGLGVVMAILSWWMWNHQYREVAGLPVLTGQDLRKWVPKVEGIEWLDDGGFEVRLKPGGGAVGAIWMLPEAFRGKSLYVMGSMKAQQLAPGTQEWEDGRVMVEWLSPQDGKMVQYAPYGSVRHDDDQRAIRHVMQARDRGANVSLRIEHLGKTGKFKVSGIKIIAVEHPAWWGWGSWAMGLAWLGWLVAMVKIVWGVRGWRMWAVGVLAWIMVMQWMVPGPWPLDRAFLGEFQVDEFSGGYEATASLVSQSGEVAVMGRMPVNETGLLKVKLWLKPLRPVLHAMLFAGPAFVLSFMLRRRQVAWLLSLLAVGVELSQYGFGYGSDWRDGVDLFTDGLGIAFGCWVYRGCRGIYQRNRRNQGPLEPRVVADCLVVDAGEK